MQVKLGTYTGNGSDDRGITGVGFQPDCVFIKGGANEWVVRTSTMATNETKQMATAAAFAADMIQTLDTDGFTIGTNARVNTNATVYYYAAIRDNGSSDFKVGTYTGNGADNRDITGVGFTPQMVIYLPAAAVLPGWNLTGTDSTSRSDNSAIANLIQAFGSGTFQVGSGSANTNLAAYHYIAFKDVSSVAKIGSYTGNGADNTSITGVGFQPDFVLTQKRTTATFRVGVLRFKDNSGDDSALLTASAFTTDLIQAFESDGFQVGTSVNTNTNTAAYDYLALKETAAGSTPISATDSATGTDAASVAITSTSDETASGVDAASVAITATVADTGAAVDATALEQQSIVTDAAAGAEATSVEAALTATDTAIGADAASVSADTPVDVTETGAGVDAAALSAALTTTETGTGTDAASLAITATVADTGSGVDAASASADTLVSADDTASGLDAVLLAVAAILAETASGLDAASVDVTLTATDAGTGADAATGGDVLALPATRAAASDAAYGGAVAGDLALVGATASDSEV